MKRAVELFTLERRPWSSPFIGATWQARSEPADSFISVAASHWEMVVTWRSGVARLTVRGPETRATTVRIPQDAWFFGIEFGPGTFMPGLPPRRLVDRSVTLPQSGDTSFCLDGSVWDVPGPDDVDGFVDRLVGARLLVHDPVVTEALQGVVRGLSTRSVERRVSRATGLTRGAIERIRRAETAVELLSQGMPASDAAYEAGYADQPHLTRSLTRMAGQTPSQIASSGAGAP